MAKRKASSGDAAPPVEDEGPEPHEEGEAAPVRPFWSGTLTFGLVSVPVDLYPAVRSRRPSLRMVDERGAPLERRYVEGESTRTVENDELVRGYEVEPGRFVLMEDEELEGVAPEKSRDIDLRRFVPVDQLDPLHYQRSYFLAPAGQSTKAYRLLAEAMERSGRAGIATFVMRGVEYLTAILAEEGILRAETLRFADEVRTPEDVGLAAPGKADAALLKRLRAEIRQRAAEALDERELADEWTRRLERLVRRKRKEGEGVVRAPEAADAPAGDGKVIDLLEVLRRSMAAAAPERAPARSPRAAAAGDDLDGLSKQQLYERARALDLPGRSSMSKAQLVRAIRGAA